jgi:hypothetical protein
LLAAADEGEYVVCCKRCIHCSGCLCLGAGVGSLELL